MPLFLDSAGMMKAALLAFAETLGARTVLGVAETVVVELSVVGVVAAEPVAESAAKSVAAAIAIAIAAAVRVIVQHPQYLISVAEFAHL